MEYIGKIKLSWVIIFDNFKDNHLNRKPLTLQVDYRKLFWSWMSSGVCNLEWASRIYSSWSCVSLRPAPVLCASWVCHCPVCLLGLPPVLCANTHSVINLETDFRENAAVLCTVVTARPRKVKPFWISDLRSSLRTMVCLLWYFF